MLVAGKAVGHAVALDEGLEVGAVRLAVFDVLDLRLVSDERGGDVGIVDRAADRRVRDLVANAAAGLEAVRKAAAPQVRLVEVMQRRSCMMLPPTVAMFLICGDAVSDAACAMAA